MFCPRGDTGGDLTGLSEMGDGGTNGNDSRIESPTDADVTTDDLDVLWLVVSKPCAIACACAWARAICCCCSKVPWALVGGVTSLPMVVLKGDLGLPAVDGGLK